MFKYTRLILAFFGVVIFILVVWASAQGWGVRSVNNKVIIQNRSTDCPEEQKDQWGNCPTRSSHRRRIGGRSHSGGGSSGGGK